MTPEQQTPASVVERLRAPHGSAYRFIAAALIERLSAENADLRERLRALDFGGHYHEARFQQIADDILAIIAKGEGR